MTRNEQELKHYGILGMKWGVRRERGKSGRVESSDSAKASSLRKKKVSEMSNQELKELNNRLQLERQYKDLTKRKTTKGEKIFNEIVTNLAKEELRNVIKKYGPAFFQAMASGYKAGKASGS